MNHTAPFLALAVLTAAPAVAQVNDECTGAIALANNSSTAYDTFSATLSATPWSCASNGAADIWYSYTTQSVGTRVTFSTCGSGYDTALELYEGSCAALTPIDCNDDYCGTQSRLSTLSPAVGTTYYIRVGGWGGSTGPGTLELTEAPDPCGTPDMFEPNVDCSTAAPTGDGTFTGLNVDEVDNDYYAVTLADGGTISVDLIFIDDDGDLDLYLWDPSLDCDYNAGAPFAAALVSSRSATDNESVSYTNTSGAALDLIIEVDMWSAGGCSTYDITIAGADPIGPGPIGSPFCPGNPNSTGATGATTAFGRLDVAANDVTLTASNLPVAQFGLFVVSQTAVAPVSVGEGNLCLGGAIGRYQGPGQILQADPMGEFSLAIDLTMIPEPSQLIAAQPGDTFRFQAWHRDFGAGGNTSNFTAGVELMLQ